MAWAPSSHNEIKALSEQEVFDDKAQVLLSDFVYGPVIRNLLDFIRKHNPGDHQGQGLLELLSFAQKMNFEFTD